MTSIKMFTETFAFRTKTSSSRYTTATQMNHIITTYENTESSNTGSVYVNGNQPLHWVRKFSPNCHPLFPLPKTNIINLH
jgi:hypothetical protein